MKLGARGVYHSDQGNVYAEVIDNEAVDPENSDNNLELEIHCPHRLEGSSGLSHGLNYRYSHVDPQTGGFTPRRAEAR